MNTTRLLVLFTAKQDKASVQSKKEAVLETILTIKQEKAIIVSFC